MLGSSVSDLISSVRVKSIGRPLRMSNISKEIFTSCSTKREQVKVE